jgi:predicted phosphate transport protein (TIGR00153 family)
MFRSLLPKTGDFFDYFEKHIALTVEACKAFVELASGRTNTAAMSSQIKKIEHDADDVTHRCIEAIHKTFITPLDRDDIHKLIKKMDDVVDAIDSTTARMELYEIKEMRPEAKELAEVLLRASTELAQAIHGLRDLKNAATITEHCIAVHQLENEADALLRASLVRLFKEVDQPILVIKWKEIYERLEKAADRCEEVANIIEGLVIEAT